MSTVKRCSSVEELQSELDKFCQGILSGEIPSCRFVKLAVKRHLKDLEKSSSDEYPYYFSYKTALKRLKLIELLPHTKGEWAFKRQLITLEPWQIFGLSMTFGWLHKGTDYRRFRESYWEVPRKNAKSTIAAGIGICMFIADGEYGAEVYSGATSEKQAWEVFRPAKLMVQRSPMLVDATGIVVNAKNMNVPHDNSRFEPVIGNPGDGASPSCALVDEYHEHPTAELYDTMETGMGARRQPLIFVITTAGYDISSPCYEKRDLVISMLEGTLVDEELWGWIWTVDEDDDWKDPKSLKKANPNYGVSVYEDYLLTQLKKAINSARFQSTFKTKHLNIWVSAKAGFINMADWEKACDKSLCLEDFEGQECVLGLDLARKLDMNSMARIFSREIDGKTHYYSVAPKFWVPEESVYNNDNKRLSERYQKWVNQGYLDMTDGAEIDYRHIREDILECNLTFPVKEIPIDPHGATAISHDLDDEGLVTVTVTQNYINMSDPMKEFEAAVVSGRFHHDGNPIMTWCVSNIVAKNLPGNDDVVRPIKTSIDGKIDGGVATIMAIGRQMAPPEEDDIDIHFL